MGTTTYISRHILRLPRTKIFTTREVLQYGSRGAVDEALSRMVASKFIVRLARGVFVKDASLNPSRKEIVKAKAAAWGKTIFKHAKKILANLGLAKKTSEDKATYAINAHSSSYGTIHGRVYFKGIGTRRKRLCQSKVGKMVYALWHLGYGGCTGRDVAIASSSLGRTERQELRLQSSIMPAWLHHLCFYRYAPANLL